MHEITYIPILIPESLNSPFFLCGFAAYFGVFLAKLLLIRQHIAFVLLRGDS